MTLPQKILIIGDPLSSLKLSTDSSGALAQAALKSGHRVFWCELENISYFNHNVVVTHSEEIKKIDTEKIEHTKSVHPMRLFSSFHACFIRKDPPFDEHYINLCWILSTQSVVKIINPPEVLLAYHEKSLHWLAHAQGVLKREHMIPTCLTTDAALLETFCRSFSSSQKFIAKPWLGHGGEGIELFLNSENLITSFKSGRLDYSLVQPFLEEITTVGDRRVLIAAGEIVGDFVRIPANGQIASNLSQGGSPVLRKMTIEQIEVCQQLARFLKQKNILFAGIDLIGTRVGEINITSPTGLRTYESLTGMSVADKVFNLLLR